MANPSVTYTFANSTTADATQVNQNFTDLINGATDGTKDYNIGVLTAAGTATLNGSVVLGNGSPKSLTINASLASSIPIQTNASYDFGTSLFGLGSLYLGSATSKTTRLVGAATTSYTFTFPVTGGSAGSVLRTDGSGGTSFVSPDSQHAGNLSLSATVGSSALTITMNDAGGSAQSSSSPSDITFRSATATTGTAIARSTSSALTIVVPSGATLGHASATTHYIYVYALDNAGTVELAVSSAFYDSGSIQSTSTIGAGSTSNSTIYSTNARSNVGIRLIGRLKVSEVTAGTWASAPTEISLMPASIQRIAFRVNHSTGVLIGTGAYAAIAFDTKDIDTHNAVSAGVFTAPAAGVYAFGGVVRQTSSGFAWGVANQVEVAVFVNNAQVVDIGFAQAMAAAVYDIGVSGGSGPVKLAKGDTVDLRVFQNSGHTLATGSTTQCSFWGCLVSEI